MDASLVASVQIACPSCGTRYQLPAEAIGPKGRKVTCANCGQTWRADGARPQPAPDPDRMFDAAAESELDAAFAEAERAAAQTAPRDPREDGRKRTIAEIKAVIERGDPPEAGKGATAARASGADRQQAFLRRHAEFGRRLPIARLRRIARIVSVSLLALLLVSAFAFRIAIVREFPALAGLYSVLGIDINVVGLEFRDVRTVQTVRNDAPALQVDARIYGVAPRRVWVPPIVVTLLDEDGRSLYEWSVVPTVRELEPAEIMDISTLLATPPANARRVRLAFATGQAHADPPVSTITEIQASD